MSTFCVVVSFLIFEKINGFSCPSTQEPDTHLLCNIFQSTNIEDVLLVDMSIDDYCSYGWKKDKIVCNSSVSSTIIDFVELERSDALNGTLNLAYHWPIYTRDIDLETEWDSVFNLYGNWNWSSIQLLDNLQELDLENNEFSSYISNQDWSIIASRPAMTDFTLFNNEFTTNFSKVTFDPLIKSPIRNMELSYNNFYGVMDVTTSGFFATFPNLVYFWLEENHNVEGNFANFDAISSDYLPNLYQFLIKDNKFTGSVTLSDGLSFSDTLRQFHIADNDFSGTIDWESFANLDNLRILNVGENSFSGSIAMSKLPSTLEVFEADYNRLDGTVPWNIFDGLYSLEQLDINDNLFTGTINWTIIADLHQNGELERIELRRNLFTGYVDFSWIIDDNLDSVDVDVNVSCDPTIYPCPGETQGKRTAARCFNRQDCEDTCQCVPTSDPTQTPTMTTSSPPITSSPITSAPITSSPTNSQITTSSPTISPITESPSLPAPSLSPVITSSTSPTTISPSLSPTTQQPTQNPTTIRPSANPTLSPSTPPVVAVGIDGGDNTQNGLFLSTFNLILIGSIVGLCCIICALVILILLIRRRKLSMGEPSEKVLSVPTHMVAQMTTSASGYAISSSTPVSPPISHLTPVASASVYPGYSDGVEGNGQRENVGELTVPMTAGSDAENTTDGETRRNTSAEVRKQSTFDPEVEKMYAEQPQKPEMHTPRGSDNMTPNGDTKQGGDNQKLAIENGAQLPKFDDNWGYDENDNGNDDEYEYYEEYEEYED